MCAAVEAAQLLASCAVSVRSLSSRCTRPTENRIVLIHLPTRGPQVRPGPAQRANPLPAVPATLKAARKTTLNCLARHAPEHRALGPSRARSDAAAPRNTLISVAGGKRGGRMPKPEPGAGWGCMGPGDSRRQLRPHKPAAARHGASDFGKGKRVTTRGEGQGKEGDVLARCHLAVRFDQSVARRLTATQNSGPLNIAGTLSRRSSKRGERERLHLQVLSCTRKKNLLS